MKFFKKPYAWAAMFSAVLFLFTLFVVLDTFVIERVYVIVDNGTETESAAVSSQPSSAETDNSAATASSTASASDTEATSNTVITENTYTDGKIAITITEYREYDTSIYVADVTLASSDYLKTAFADNAYGKNVTEATSAIAEESGAILAINGDYYGAQNSGYVIRNGVIYRETISDSSQEDLVIYEDGSFDIVTEGSVSASELLESGAVQVLSFGPGLVEDGEVAVTASEEVDKAMTSNPRTAIGILGENHYVLVVSDGRTEESTGLTLYQLATFMQEELGVTTAYNLDGGGSSTMYFNGKVVNNPTTDGRSIKERSVSDIVYIG